VVITVHHLQNSRSQRVLWLLEELSVPYEVKRYERDAKTMLAPPELRAVHPLGKSPVITDAAVTVAESGAIVEYLVDQYGGGRLIPAPGTAERRLYTFWLHYAEGSAMPWLLLKLVFDHVASTPLAWPVSMIARGIAGKVQSTFIAPQLDLHLNFMESELGRRAWFAGSEFTAADVLMSFPVEAAAARGGVDASRPRLAGFCSAYMRAMPIAGRWRGEDHMPSRIASDRRLRPNSSRGGVCMRLGVLILSTFLTGSAAAAPSDGYETYSGTAVGRRSAEFLYGERHVLRYQDGRIAERTVLYTCRDGSPFARKLVNYVDPVAPDFHLQDVVSGLEEGIRTDGTGREVFFRANPRDAIKSGPLPRVDGLVADAGFDEFVRANWQRLMSDQALKVHFLVPTRLDDYSFQVQHLRSDRIEGIPTEVFRLRLSGIWGWFLPGIDVYYSAQERILVHYDGLSDLRDAAGDNYQAKITFNPGDRRPSDERSMREAREARLGPCKKS
jgi:glutathione S-transferase